MLALFVAAAMAAAAPGSAGEGSVSLRRGPDAPQPVVSWFSLLEKVLDGSRRLTGLLAREAAKPTVGAAREALAQAAALATDYEELAKDSAARKGIERLKARLEAAMKGLPETAILPTEASELLFSLKTESVNRWAQLMPQGALEEPGPKGKFPANSLVALEKPGALALELPALDVSKAPLVREGRIASAGLWALVLALRQEVSGLGTVVLSRHRLWMRPFGAEVYADLSEPGSGGMVRVRYREAGGAPLDQAGFYFLTRALYELGFGTGVDNGELVASLEGRGLDPGRTVERLAAALKALESRSRMKPALAVYLRDTNSEDENARLVDDVVGLFMAEGRLPLDKEPAALAAAVQERRDAEPTREALRGSMNKTLAALGLKPFPTEAPVGQRTIDLYYNAPIEAALARGALRLADGRPVRTKGYDPLGRLAGQVPGIKPGGPGLVRLAPLLDQLETIGSAGPWLAQRGQWRLDPRQWIILYVLRGPDGRIGATIAETGTADAGPKSLATDAALALLEDIGLISSDKGPEKTWPWPARTLYAGSGLPFTARVTYDRAKALLGDAVYVTPYVAPADESSVRHALALITTSGGEQAAIMAALAGKPAMNLGVAEWSEGSGIQVAEAQLSPPRPTPFGVPVRDAVKSRRLTVREGEALRLDPALQKVEFLDPERQEILVKLEEALKVYDRGGDINALALWASGQLRASVLTPAQKRILASELTAEMEKRRKTGVPPAHVERIRAVLKE